MKILMALLLGVVMACGNGCGCKKQGEVKSSDKVAAPKESFTGAPAVSLQSWTGKDSDDKKTTVDPVVDDDAFKDGDEIVLQFSADWCRPCHALKAIINGSEAIQKHFTDETRGFWVIDTEDTDKITLAWLELIKVSALPTVVRCVYEDGDWSETHRFVGLLNERQVLDFLNL